MQTVSIQVDVKQIENVIEQLDDKEKFKIAENIITKQFKNVVDKFRKTIKKKKLTCKAINDIVEKAREEFYAKNRDRY